MRNSAMLGYHNVNEGQDCFHVLCARDRNSSDFPRYNEETSLKRGEGLCETAEMRIKTKNKKAGRAAQALRALRERVEYTPNKPRLTFEQMALECGFFKKRSDDPNAPSPSTYQYNESEYKKDWFPKEKVDVFKVPLVERGIPEAEIYEILTGISYASPSGHREVNLPSGTARRVPVISRDAALRISRGELILGSIAELDPAVIQKLEAVGDIMGWESLRRVSDQTVILEVLDGLGTEIAVDLSDKILVEGKQYVLRHGDQMVFVTYEEGMVVAEEGPHSNETLDFGKRVPIVLGRVVKTILNN